MFFILIELIYSGNLDKPQPEAIILMCVASCEIDKLEIVTKAGP